MLYQVAHFLNQHTNNQDMGSIQGANIFQQIFFFHMHQTFKGARLFTKHGTWDVMLV